MPQTSDLQAVTGAVTLPQASGLPLPASPSGAVGPGNSSAAWVQPQNHDATAVEQHRAADEDRPFPSGIDSSSNSGYIGPFLLLRFFGLGPSFSLVIYLQLIDPIPNHLGALRIWN